MTRKRCLSAAGLGLVLVLVAAGCGGQPFPAAGPSGSPQARLLAAAQRAAASRTARIALQMSFSLGAADAASFSGAGVVDLAGGAMDLRLHSRSHGNSTSIEMRIVDRTAYINEGGGWTRLALDGRATSVAVPDPTSYVDFLQGVSDDVRFEGHDTLRGDDTTRYGATVDLERALARASVSAPTRAALENEMAMLGDLEIPVTVWVDTLGRLRKVSLTMDLSTAASRLRIPNGLDPRIEAAVEFYDFGVPVDVVVPAGA